MLEHVDAALTALVRAAVPPGVTLRPDPPGPDLGGDGEVLSVFLHRVVEDLTARAAAWSDELDEQGRVVARVLPPRRYRFCYLITAWAPAREAEHARLGAVLAAMAPLLHVPGEYLPAPLRAGPAVGLDVAHPDLPGVAADLWTSFGVPPRTGLDVVLTVTMTPAALGPLPAAPSTVDLGVAGGPPPQPVPEAAAVPPARRIRE
ncbi:Pvc16 family protein [Amycolatopsis sp. lyj-23]|uniref:Pvc16 family protein n=1 Tax=Amycolatopsis sp. lyj-23 TaxID=2789283 RepID=UPI003979EBC6